MGSPKQIFQLKLDTRSACVLTPDTASSTESPSPQSKSLWFGSSPAEETGVNTNTGASDLRFAAKRPKRTLKHMASGAEMSSKGRPKGCVRYTVDRGLEHFLEYERIWIPAVYHNDIRAELIEEAARYGHYDHPRHRGRGATDETSFLPAHKTWGPAQEDWPEALCQPGLERKPEPMGAETIPMWFRDGRVVLDDDDDPLRFLPDLIPATCSSEMENWELQAIYYSDPRIMIADIRGRMPKTITQADGSEKPLFKPNAISMRMTRFRTKAGLSPQKNTQNWSRRSEALHPQDMVRQILEPNSCRHRNKRLAENTCGSEESSYIIGSPTKRARRPPLQSQSAVSDDMLSKLTRSDSSTSADYSTGYGTPTDTAGAEILSPHDLKELPVRYPRNTVGLGLDFRTLSGAEMTKITKAYNTKFMQTPDGTPILGHGDGENFYQDDPFYDNTLQKKVNISPKPILQQKRSLVTGDVSMPEEFVTDTEFAQNGTIFEDLTEFLATLSPSVGDGRDGQAMYPAEPTSPLQQKESLALPTEATFAERHSEGAILDEFTEFLAKLDAEAGLTNNGIFSHAEPTGNSPLLTNTTSANKEFEQNEAISDDVAKFLASLDTGNSYYSQGVSPHVVQQTSPAGQTKKSPQSIKIAPANQTRESTLFAAPDPVDQSFLQDEDTADFLAELNARCPAIIGHRLDGTPIYENELASSFTQTGNTTFSRGTASTPKAIDQVFHFGSTGVSPESDIATPSPTNPTSQGSTTASSTSTLCNGNDLSPSSDEDLAFFEPLESLIARGLEAVQHERGTEVQSTIGQHPEQVEVASKATVPDEAGPVPEEDQVAGWAGLPEIIGIDQYGGAIWADGFRFKPEETYPNGQSQQPLEPQYSLTIDNFAIDDNGNLWVPE